MSVTHTTEYHKDKTPEERIIETTDREGNTIYVDSNMHPIRS